MNHIMLDLETMGTGSNAVIVSISAVVFDMTTGEIGEQFEMGIDMKSQTLKGGEIDADTVNWWSVQNKEARDELERLEKHDTDYVLEEFNKWINTNFKAKSKIKMWGNGATFDNVILRNLYKRHDVIFDVPYYCDKDVRTLTYLMKIQPKFFGFIGVKHRGIDDCKHQINYCVYAYAKIDNALKYMESIK